MCIDDKYEFLLNLFEKLLYTWWHSIKLNGDGDEFDFLLRWVGWASGWDERQKQGSGCSNPLIQSPDWAVCEHGAAVNTKNALVLHWGYHPRCTKSDNLSAQSPVERQSNKKIQRSSPQKVFHYLEHLMISTWEIITIHWNSTAINAGQVRWSGWLLCEAGHSPSETLTPDVTQPSDEISSPLSMSTNTIGSLSQHQ